MSKVTLQTIAEKTGLSQSTISRVLRGRTDVSEVTRGRVIADLQRLGYSTETRAAKSGRPPRERRVRNVALVCHSHDVVRRDPFTAPILASALNAAGPLGVKMLPIDWKDLTRPLAELENVHGALLMGYEVTSRTSEIGKKMPCVTIDAYVPGSGADGVIPDYRRGAFECSRYLIGKGHKRLALISARCTEHEDFFTQQYDGARRAFEMAGIPPGKHLIAGMTMRPDDGYELAMKLLRLPEAERPTAMMGSDYAVLGALRAAHDLKIKVPDELALVGTDDIELSSFSVPRLSTVKVDKEALGRMAVERLIWRLDHRQAAQCRLVIDCPLLIRDSC